MMVSLVTSKAQSMSTLGERGQLLIVNGMRLASRQGCMSSATWTGVWSCYLEWSVIILGILLNCSVQWFFLICKMITTLARSLWRIKNNLYFIAKGLKNYTYECILFLIWFQFLEARRSIHWFSQGAPWHLSVEVGRSDIWAQPFISF